MYMYKVDFIHKVEFICLIKKDIILPCLLIAYPNFCCMGRNLPLPISRCTVGSVFAHPTFRPV